MNYHLNVAKDKDTGVVNLICYHYLSLDDLL